jgi:hypothetical protein
MRARIDNMDDKRIGELRHTPRRRIVNSNLQDTFLKTNPDAMLETFPMACFTEHAKALSTRLHQPTGLTGTERSAPAQQEHAFQETGFTGPVRAQNDVAGRRQLHAHTRQATY